KTGAEVRRLSGHEQGVSCIAFTPDGLRALSSGGDRTIRLWDVETGLELRKFDVDYASTSLLPLPDGRRALSDGIRMAHFDNPQSSHPAEFGLCLWDLETGRRLRIFDCSND